MTICAALNANPRGAFIDIPMVDAVLATMGWVVSNHLIGGITPERQGNENPTSAPSGAFQCADGLLNIAANKDEQWQALAQHLGRADLLEHPDFATREDRKRNRLRLRAELETVLTTRPASDWADALNAIGVPAGAVMSVPDILSHPQITTRDLLARFDNTPGVGRAIDVLRIGALINGVRPAVATPPPALGADSDAILRDLGYSAQDIATFRAEGVT